MVNSKIKAKNMKVCLQVGNNPNKGRKMGVPAHVMVSMLMEMVLNLIAI